MIGEKETKPKRRILMTPHGEADVDVYPDGNRILHPLKTEPLKPLPTWFNEIHASEMKLFHSILMYIKKHYPNRNLPVTRNEFLKSGADVTIVNKLVKAGLLHEQIIQQPKTPARTCYYYTAQGRAFIRERLDPSYALTENVNEQRIREPKEETEK